MSNTPQRSNQAWFDRPQMRPVTVILAILLAFGSVLGLKAISAALPKPTDETHATKVIIENPASEDHPYTLNAALFTPGGEESPVLCLASTKGFVNGWNCENPQLKVRKMVVNTPEDPALAIRRILRADLRSDLPAGESTNNGRITTLRLSSAEAQSIDSDLGSDDVIAGLLVAPPANAENQSALIVTVSGPANNVDAALASLQDQAAEK